MNGLLVKIVLTLAESIRPLSCHTLAPLTLMSQLEVRILTVSDRCSRGEAVDGSGPALEHTIGAAADRFKVG